MFISTYSVFKQAVMITGFVFVMMLAIEYLNVFTKGLWQQSIKGGRWKQYVLSAILGAVPGCLGAFTAVALFSHRLISFGAIVTAMIATSGDEAFVMFAMFPQKALLLTIAIFLIGIVAGFLTDTFYKPAKVLDSFVDNAFPLHKEEKCNCFPKDKIWHFIVRPSVARLALAVIILSLILGLVTGVLSGKAALWKKVTIMLSFLFSLFIVLTVPEHFLKEHLWNHLVKVHLPRIFLWTFGVLLFFYFAMQWVDLHAWMSNNMLVVLILAILIGIIPESGPHLIFVTLFAQGVVPFSVLLASSIAQDGHGMLPLLAESKKGFVQVKLVNMIFALITGISVYWAGF